MQPREIEVFSAGDQDLITITSNATTWGELKQHPEVALRLSRRNLAAMIKEGRHTLEVDDATLPETAFTLFLVAKQQKAGTEEEQLLESINDLEAEFLSTIQDMRDYLMKEGNITKEAISASKQAIIDEYNNIVLSMML